MKPEFFKHSGLYQAEVESGLPLRLAFEGLWTVADREGRFRWKAPELKLEVLPYDAVDFGAVLAALERYGFARRYIVGGKDYGVIDSFSDHQTFHPHEAKSTLPTPPLVADVSASTDNGGTCQPVSVSVSTSISSTDSSDTTYPGEPGRKDEPRSDLATVMGAARQWLWPDGKHPEGRSGEVRDGSVAKALLQRHPVGAVAQAVEGLRRIVDRGGLPPHCPGEPLRLRKLDSKHNGVVVFQLALDAYYAQAPPEPTKRGKTGPMAIGDLLREAG